MNQKNKLENIITFKKSVIFCQQDECWFTLIFFLQKGKKTPEKSTNLKKQKIQKSKKLKK